MSTRTILIGLMAFVVGVPVSLGVLSWWVRSQRIPELSKEALDAAEQRWQQGSIANYDARIELTGKRAGVVMIAVRDSTPVSMTRDGVTPKRSATWHAWSVPGMFETLRLELEVAEKPQTALGVATRDQVVLRAEFDADTGLPRRYQRVVYGVDNELSWTVTLFNVDPER